MSINGDASIRMGLLNNEVVGPSFEKAGAEGDNDNDNKDQPGKNKLGTCNGVIIPCLLNIFGAIIFVRLPWAVGQSGWFGVVLQFVLGGSLVTLTTLSIAAISTNGLVRGGGAYYMLSRTLGPEFGVAVGVAYYFAASISIAFYLIAFAENMVSSIGDDFVSGFPGQESGLQLMIASLALFLLLIQAQLGADSVAKANSFIFVLLITSILLAVISFLTGGGHKENYLASHGYTPLNWERFKANAWAQADTRQCVCTVSNHQAYDADNETCGQLKCEFEASCTADDTLKGLFDAPASLIYGNRSQNKSVNRWVVPREYECPHKPREGNEADEGSSPTGFFQVFIVIFPAVTGIMAGTNFSGDLADPGKSIGYGTLVAIGSSIVVYLGFALIMGASLTNAVMADQDASSVIIQEIAFHPAIVVAGVVASTISSALGALVGSARILQALARDELLPGISMFGYGSPGADEPRVALLLSWALGQGFLFLGDLNTVSALISELFLLVYFSLNIACFALRVSGAPNFRPHFRNFSWRTALAGSLLALSVMFISSPLYALVAIGAVVLLSLVVYIYAPPKPWGDVSQAIIFHQVRKYLLRLDIRRQHPKFWRPSILLCVDTPHSSGLLIDFCNSLKKGGLYIIGNVVVASPSKRMSNYVEQMRLLWIDYIKITRIKAFSELCISQSLRSGFYAMFMLSGIGGMKPNTVVFQFLPFEEDDIWRGKGDSMKQTSSESMSKSSQLEIEAPDSSTENKSNGYFATPYGERYSSSQKYLSPKTKPSMLMLGSDLRRTRQIEAEQNVLDRMDSVRAKMEHVMQETVENDQTCGTNHYDVEDDDEGAEKNASKTPKLLRSSSSMIESNALGAMANLQELVAIMSDALALEKNIVLTRHFEKLDANKLKSFCSTRHSSVGDKDRMSVDVWVLASDTANPDWDAMEGDFSLQAQLAYCLLAGRKTAWYRYTYLRVVVVSVFKDGANTIDNEVELNSCKERAENMLREIRIPAEVYVVSGTATPKPGSSRLDSNSGSSPPPSLSLKDLNDLIVQETKDAAMLFLQLPDTPFENFSAQEAEAFASSVKTLTDNLPPLALVKSARQRTMTTEL